MYLVLLEHHKVEMFEALGSVVAHSLLERWGVHNVAHVLVYESVSASRNIMFEAIEAENSDNLLGNVLLCS